MSEAPRPVTWITGAGKGIGRALALHLAAEGATVAASARTLGDLDTLVAEADRSKGGSIHPFALDTTQPEAVAAGVEAIEGGLGPITQAVLNAGTDQSMGVADFSTQTLRAVIEVNLLGTASCLEAVLPPMRRRKSGRIAVVSSVAGYRGLPTAAAYGPTKAALTNMMESLKIEAAQAGILLQVINPGFVRTPLTDRNPFPMPFLIEADEAAARIADGLRSKAFEITFPKRFTYGLKLARLLPYALYFPLIAKITGSPKR
ncbi:SDR family NAD(P)-dependent oxidoreductase [Rhodospirillum rubrum]|uniref:Short-chain dehydrogenase/reductase SDR n=1 Tax=Rhodospirillum rubrum (strain ATCC 11170 / ATH 1.1.1 / DSM 467 / LMG 4362 / NCIMB 8255 / S1) TaxID=269796 RepID=Q2RWG2_RHORT|nr:SDR family NAD(P)-dependent oxidoreductase [Rhodospirillum rubrum]ABC21533.1 Short-chain dehydrogenase/reductase SDR [Rhodospirillum rubrum ATCC 11170]AEO47218.1 short-chain dehydrogenase/reductase sDR [Rhodospirillum rubrum F11]MBK5953155.1 oxidoreductase [Rhodospirillum rubrum]QXG81205.1 SDR family NAD(P)-dependent oxidoreductase [Rhodospirillum rubrum]HAQ00371.1 oxidoreductase [Rhodospirillum rubrum]